MSNRHVINLLSAGGFILCNQKIAQTLSLHSAVILGSLCSLYEYHSEHGTLVNDMFYCTAATLQQKTTLNSYEQRKAIANLIDAGILSVIKTGLPARNHFKIHTDAIIKVLESDPEITEK